MESARYLRIAEASSARVIAQAVNVTILFLTARVLGAANRGVVVEITVWGLAFGSLAALSLGQLLQSRIQFWRGEDWRSRTIIPALSIFSVFTVMMELFLWLLAWSGHSPVRSSPHAVALLALYFPMMAWWEFSPGYFAASGQLRVFNITLVACQFLNLAGELFYLLYFGGRSPETVILILSLGQGLMLAVNLAWVLRGRLWLDARTYWVEVQNYLRGIVRLHPNTISSLLQGQLHNLILSVLVSTASLAVFQLGYQLVYALQILPFSAGLVMFSELSHKTPDEAWTHQRRLACEVLIALAIIGVAFYFLLPRLVPLLAGPQFVESAWIAILLMPVVWISGLAMVLWPQWITRGFFVAQSLVTTLTTVLVAIADYVLILRYGIRGPIIAAWIAAFGLSLPMQVVFALYIERKRHKAAAG